MPNLPYRVDRSVVIRAPRENVYRFLTDTPRWATWWGAGSRIDARPGGALLIRFPDGTEVTGEVVDMNPPERMVFTYGFVKGEPIAPGGSVVTIRLAPHGLGTEVHVTHEFDAVGPRDHHIQGWRYQLALFANVVTDELHANAASLIDAWFDAWAEPDQQRRESTFRRIADDGVLYHDRFSNTSGLDDLFPHVAAAQIHMAGLRTRRAGDVRHCQGTVLADWIAAGGDGQERARGTSVFVLGPAGRIQSVTGFWTLPR